MNENSKAEVHIDETRKQIVVTLAKDQKANHLTCYNPRVLLHHNDQGEVVRIAITLPAADWVEVKLG